MGIVKKGPATGWSGKVGNQVYSQHPDRETTVTEPPTPTDLPPTVDQLRVRQVTTICGKYLSPLKDFVKVGAHAKGKPKGQTPYNVMLSGVRANAIKGEYPNQYLDYSKLRITQGTMSPPTLAIARLTDQGFAFEWNPDNVTDDDHYTDQVMVMAYFPELRIARYKTCCAERHKGEYLLLLAGIKKGYTAEIYIGFITDERDRISDSVYLGQLIW
ncbi:hypothetical protein SAMN06265348_101549 [Pedobacter westerhofensis]|uniref:Uncharacterized protein n=2 Tax=Pedobacter westerhofensis TaxID=425512 RepID=A0A521AYL4_9SPHI|nr:hypothetical protein SAMN06265348_101549 [Pedobacter westerhofensis]